MSGDEAKDAAGDHRPALRSAKRLSALRPGVIRKATGLLVIGTAIEFSSNYIPPMPFNEVISSGLTLVAVLVLGGTAIWVVRGLGPPGTAARIVVLAVALVVLSELMSTVETIPYLNRVPVFQNRNPIHLLIENAMSDVGLVLLLVGLLVSAVEGHTLRQAFEARSEALTLEVAERCRIEDKLRREEDAKLHFRQQLTALHDVGDLLTRCGSSDELCRRAVELGCTGLGFERLSIWLVDQEPRFVRGTFGVDESGNVRDERSRRVSVELGSHWEAVLLKNVPLEVSSDHALYNDEGQVVGHGGLALAGMLTGERTIGVLTADTFFTGAPITGQFSELLTLYASTIGHLYSLLESEERFRAHYRALPLPAYTWRRVGEDFVLMDLNDAGLAFTQGRVAEWIGKKARDFHEGEPEVLDDLARSFAERSVVRRNMLRRLVRTTGEEKYLSVTYAFVPPDFVTVYVEDVTQRRKAERALRESEENFRALAENALNGIFVVDRDGRHVYGNPAMAQLAGYSGSDWLSTQMEDVAHPDDIPQLRRRLDMRLRGDAIPKQYETRLIRKDGVCLPIEIVASKTMWQGRPAVLVFVSDLTERRRAAQLIAEHQANLVAASRLSSLGAMASGLAHEINNPLAVISGTAEQLQEYLATALPHEDRLMRAMATIGRNAGRIESIVRGLRGISRDGSTDPFLPAALRAIVQDTLELCRARFCAHGIDLRVDDIPDDLEIECRATQVSQILMNLLNNAFDALGHNHGEWVRVEFREAGESVELAVADSGESPPVQMHERLFEPFFTTKAVGKGTGLGLSIARAIVEDHRGTLVLDPASPHTRFVMRLHKCRPPASPNRSAS